MALTYDNSARAAAAQVTRTRVLTAARASFLERGFAGTTIRLVAGEAGVSQETIFKAFGSKAALLKAVYDVMLVGDEEEVPLAQRPEAIAVRQAATPEEAVVAYTELGRMVSERIDPLLRVLSGAWDTDPALAEFLRTINEERRRGSAMFIGHWHAKGWLREDLEPERATDILWALNSPEPRWLLAERGWSMDEIAAWLAQTLRHALLG